MAATVVHDFVPGTRIHRATWAGLVFTGVAANDVGPRTDYSQWADRNVQVFGTFGAAGSIRITGSNDGATWTLLTDMAGGALTFTSAGVKMIQENVLYVRPEVTAGDGTTALQAVLIARRTS